MISNPHLFSSGYWYWTWPSDIRSKCRLQPIFLTWITNKHRDLTRQLWMNMGWDRSSYSRVTDLQCQWWGRKKKYSILYIFLMSGVWLYSLALLDRLGLGWVSTGFSPPIGILATLQVTFHLIFSIIFSISKWRYQNVYFLFISCNSWNFSVYWFVIYTPTNTNKSNYSTEMI
jgi:hypothetical protein